MNRVTYDEKGELDEIVTDGGCHLERLSKKTWFLCCERRDGTSVAVWIKGKVTQIKEREPGELLAWRSEQMRSGYVSEFFGVCKEDGISGVGWVIIHLPTGLQCCDPQKRLKDAEKIIGALESCGVDWSKTRFSRAEKRTARVAVGECQ